MIRHVVIPGVTIKTVSPSVDNITTVMEDTEPFGDAAGDEPAVKTSRQNGVGVTWDKPPKDENIDGMCKFWNCHIVNIQHILYVLIWQDCDHLLI